VLEIPDKAASANEEEGSRSESERLVCVSGLSLYDVDQVGDGNSGFLGCYRRGIVLPCESALFVAQPSGILLIVEAWLNKSGSGDILARAVCSLVGWGVSAASGIVRMLVRPL